MHEMYKHSLKDELVLGCLNFAEAAVLDKVVILIADVGQQDLD